MFPSSHLVVSLSRGPCVNSCSSSFLTDETWDWGEGSETRKRNERRKKLIKSWWKCMQWRAWSWRNESIMKTFTLLAHVTCSKLKLNCTNPSYRSLDFTIPLAVCVWLTTPIIIHFYFPFLLEMPFFLRFIHFIIISLFCFPLSASRRFISGYPVWNSFSARCLSFCSLISSRHWCVRSLNESSIMKHVELVKARKKKSSDALMKKWVKAKNWQHFIN